MKMIPLIRMIVIKTALPTMFCLLLCDDLKAVSQMEVSRSSGYSQQLGYCR
jgi:hypothetical protein